MLIGSAKVALIPPFHVVWALYHINNEQANLQIL